MGPTDNNINPHSSENLNLGPLTPEPTTEETLPTEILALILSKLETPEDLLSATKVNKSWSNITIDNVRKESAFKFRAFVKFVVENMKVMDITDKQKLKELILSDHISNSVGLIEIKKSSEKLEKDIIALLKHSHPDKILQLKSSMNNPELQDFNNLLSRAALYSELDDRAKADPPDFINLRRICMELIDLNDTEKAFEVFLYGYLRGSPFPREVFERILKNPPPVAKALELADTLENSGQKSKVLVYATLILAKRKEEEKALSVANTLPEGMLVSKATLCEELLLMGKANLALNIILNETDQNQTFIMKRIATDLSRTATVDVLMQFVNVLPAEPPSKQADFKRLIYEEFLSSLRRDANDSALQLEACHRVISFLAGTDEKQKLPLQIETCLMLSNIKQVYIAIDLALTLPEDSRNLALKLITRNFLDQYMQDKESGLLTIASGVVKYMSNDEAKNPLLREIALARFAEGDTFLATMSMPSPGEDRDIVYSASAIAYAREKDMVLANSYAKNIDDEVLKKQTQAEVSKYEESLLSAVMKPLSNFANRFKPRKPGE